MPTQYHCGSGTFVTASTPVTVTTANAPMPISELGKPSADACGVVITEPHDTIGLRLHDGTYDGLSRISIFSAVSTHHALASGTGAGGSDGGVESSTGPLGLAEAVAVTTPQGSQPSQGPAH